MDAGSLSFERVSVQDADTLFALEKRFSASRTYSVFENLKEVLEEIRDHCIFFIKKEGEIVGTIAYQIRPDESVYISNVAVVPEYRGEGIARAGMKYIFDNTQGAHRFDLVVHPENENALRLYISLGFSVEKRIENYYGDGEPRLVLAFCPATIPR